MGTTVHTCAASSLLADLFAASEETSLREVTRNRLSVHYETGRADVPVLSVCLPDAVRLPGSFVVPTLPVPGPAAVIDGRLRSPRQCWTVGRWWRPSRPRRYAAAHGAQSAIGGDLAPHQLIGSGPGLTPAGDDVVAGALVAAYAFSDPRRGHWIRQTRAALDAGRTTAVSHAMLHHAMDGFATPQLAAYVDALGTGHGVADARRALLAVGHTSGAALLHGADLVVPTAPREGAA